MDILFFLQESLSGAIQDGVGITPPTVGAPVGNFSVMDQLMKGWYIYVPQLIMSVIAVYVIIERTLTVGRADKEEANFMEKIKEYVSQGKLDSAQLVWHLANPCGAYD